VEKKKDDALKGGGKRASLRCPVGKKTSSRRGTKQGQTQLSGDKGRSSYPEGWGEEVHVRGMAKGTVRKTPPQRSQKLMKANEEKNMENT